MFPVSLEEADQCFRSRHGCKLSITTRDQNLKTRNLWMLPLKVYSKGIELVVGKKNSKLMIQEICGYVAGTTLDSSCIQPMY